MAPEYRSSIEQGCVADIFFKSATSNLLISANQQKNERKSPIGDRHPCLVWWIWNIHIINIIYVYEILGSGREIKKASLAFLFGGMWFLSVVLNIWVGGPRYKIVSLIWKQRNNFLSGRFLRELELSSFAAQPTAVEKVWIVNEWIVCECEGTPGNDDL